jgi:hypothetical protein
MKNRIMTFTVAKVIIGLILVAFLTMMTGLWIWAVAGCGVVAVWVLIAWFLSRFE